MGLVTRASDRSLVSRTLDKGFISRTSDRVLVSRISDKGLIARTSDRGIVSRTSDKGLVSQTSDRGLIAQTSDKDLVSRISDRCLVSRTLLSDASMKDFVPWMLLSDASVKGLVYIHHYESSEAFQRLAKRLSKRMVAFVAYQADTLQTLPGKLGLKLDDQTRLSARVDRLRREKMILIIVDDAWKRIDLDEDIGVSFGGDQKQCKILLTSRFYNALKNDVKNENIFEVGKLSGSEPLDLFNKTADDSNGKPEFPDLASQIVKECDGLPLVLIVVASALRKQPCHVWKNALHELRMSSPNNIKGMHERVYSSVRLGNIALIGELKNLEILDLSCSEVEELGSEIRQLTQLKLSMELERSSRLDELGLGNLLKRSDVIELYGLEDLESLQLQNLVKLEKICHGRLAPDSFHNLRRLIVFKCDRLKSIFCFSIAKLLEAIVMDDCKMIEEIVDNDETMNAKIEFPRLHILRLEELPQLLQYCSDHQPKSTTNTSAIPLFNEKVVLDKLEELTVDSSGVMDEIWHTQSPAAYFYELKIYCHKGVVAGSAFIPICLSALKLSRLPNLMHLLTEVQKGKVLRNLRILGVIRCGILKSLVPSSMSFRNLTALRVSECYAFKNLLASSMATSLSQLIRLSITDCEGIIEIVANEGDDTNAEVVFENLKF
ncbi:probable disease resistance protein At5g47260 [Ziziphus jujuba]|uniref:Probable disease resistance protein At5g47260 n=1 Tax=Ziziphus jujuba TaxID=326968 RepID=A0ABM3ZUD5_ZIZJJ|nr:probable disease resistance protein At5g47260 [Ziziphus jujuba]